MKRIDIFVPGRLCLLGEHSDWAGTNRLMNSSIVPGCAIVTGIEQGIYASVTVSDTFIVESNLESIPNEKFESEMDTEKLRKAAVEGGFFSYVAGVASYINEHYQVNGIHVKITKMDLPIKRGLSSSAAICVLIVRAFNILYNLHLNTDGEMYIAYKGELRTPSRCGRLDQSCAYGVNPVYMTFDGQDISVKPIKISKSLYFVVGNLNAKKDTIKILADLNSCYPFAKNKKEENVHEALGKDNKLFVDKAVSYIERGDVKKLGKLMVEYQENFDKKVAPVCPEELTAPVLHSVMYDPDIKEFVYGCKGVGSQGDGTIQFLAKNKKCQQSLIEYLKNKYDVDAISFTLSSRRKQKIKKAIIPVAGAGTRLFPATKNLKKCFLPVMDKDGLLKPMLLILLEQLVEAGIEEICLVIGKHDKAIFEAFFKPLDEVQYDKLTPNQKKCIDNIVEIGKKIVYVIQKKPKGFGHAVYQCRDFVQEESTLLLLGDMIYHSYSNINCMSQMMKIYEKYGVSVISMHEVSKNEVIHYGILQGKWKDRNETVLNLETIKEKPSVEYAEEFLKVRTKKADENYYAVFGQYILTKEVFAILKEYIDNDIIEEGEIQLTSVLDKVRKRFGMIGYKIDGKSYDVGLPDKYMETFQWFNKEK